MNYRKWASFVVLLAVCGLVVSVPQAPGQEKKGQPDKKGGSAPPEGPKETTYGEGLGEGNSGFHVTVTDPAFDRYVDLSKLPAALANQNAEAICDLALQLAQGEHTLIRKHKGVTSLQLAKLATRTATATADKETLKRLATFADRIGDKAFAQQIELAQETAGKGRPAKTPLLVNLADASTEQVEVIKGYANEIEAISTYGAKKDLEELEAVIGRDADLTDEQKKQLQATLAEAKKTAGAKNDSAELLAQLSGGSRDIWGGIADTFKGGANTVAGKNYVPIYVKNNTKNKVWVLLGVMTSSDAKISAAGFIAGPHVFGWYEFAPGERARLDNSWGSRFYIYAEDSTGAWRGGKSLSFKGKTYKFIDVNMGSNWKSNSKYTYTLNP